VGFSERARTAAARATMATRRVYDAERMYSHYPTLPTDQFIRNQRPQARGLPISQSLLPLATSPALRVRHRSYGQTQSTH
tara:strand:+ start:1085 stop:1324 length:240 start_codon:yes stop_codon:yes gene_type:complete